MFVGGRNFPRGGQDWRDDQGLSESDASLLWVVVLAIVVLVAVLLLFATGVLK